MPCRIAAVAAAVLALVLTTDVQAQRPRGGRVPQGFAPPGQPPKAKAESFRGKGEIVAVNPGSVTIKAAESGGTPQEMTMRLSKNSSLRVIGEAERSFLATGQQVQFSAIVDPKGQKVRGPVEKIVVFTPSPEFTLGKQQDVGVEIPKSDDDFTKWKAYVFGGTIQSVQDDSMVVAVPTFNPKFKVELSPKLKVTVNVADFSIIAPGDAVDISGGSKLENVVTVSKGSIKLKNKLTEPPSKKKPTVRGK